MKKKKVSHDSMDFCPKKGTPACCVQRRERLDSNDPFSKIDSAVQDVWLAFSGLEPSIKDIKQIFAQRLLMSYLFQCTRMGLTEDDMKILFEEELKRHHDKLEAFREISEKLRKEKTGYDLA